MRHMIFIHWFASLVLVWAGSTALGQKGNSARQDERKENERVAKAERDVNEAKKDLAAIQKVLRSESVQVEKMSQSLRELKKRVREVREDAEDRLGAKIGIPSALANVRTAGTALEQCAVQVRKDVHTTKEWVSAKAAADQAKNARDALLDELNPVDDEDNEPLKALLQVIRKPMELEDDAMAKDPGAVNATKHLSQQQVELDRLRKLLPSGQVDKDREVVQATQAVGKKEKELSEAESQFKKSKSEAVKIQRRLAENQLSLQRARAADAADPNRPGKSKGK